jgi:flagellar biosynthesis protein FliQ
MSTGKEGAYAPLNRNDDLQPGLELNYQYPPRLYYEPSPEELIIAALRRLVFWLCVVIAVLVVALVGVSVGLGVRLNNAQTTINSCKFAYAGRHTCVHPLSMLVLRM